MTFDCEAWFTLLLGKIRLYSQRSFPVPDELFIAYLRDEKCDDSAMGTRLFRICQKHGLEKDEKVREMNERLAIMPVEKEEFSSFNRVHSLWWMYHSGNISQDHLKRFVRRWIATKLQLQCLQSVGEVDWLEIAIKILAKLLYIYRDFDHVSLICHENTL